VANFLAGLKEEKELNERAAQLQAEYERTLKLENARIDYSHEVSALHLWIESANEIVKDPIRCDTVEAAQELLQQFNQLKGEIPQQQTKLQSVLRLSQELAAAGVTNIGPHSPSDIQSRWDTFLADTEGRKGALEAELSKQKHNEALRVSFAEKAKAFHAFIQQNSAAVNKPGSGELEEQLATIQGLKPAIFAGNDQLTQVEALDAQLSEAGVTHNPHTDLTYTVLRADYQALVKETNNKEALIQKEIIQKSGSRVSAEQLKEFKEVFDQFDKDRRGSHNRLQFKSCLQSLGEDLSDAELDKIIANIGTNGLVPFDAFCGFMEHRSADSDSKDQIIDAFKALGGDKGFVTEDELRRALPAEKVAYLTQHMPLFKGQAGNFDFVAWASSCF